MTLLAGNVIDAARDRHAAFDRQRHPNKMLLRFLSRYARQLHGKLVALDPDAVRVETTANLPLADFDAGIALPANTVYVAEVAASYPAPSTLPPLPIDLIQSDERDAWNRPRAVAWQVGDKLYLGGTADAWTAFGQIAISSVQLPVALVALTDAIALPDAAESACVEAVAEFMAKREAQEGNDKIALAVFGEDAAKAEGAYLAVVMNNVAGRTFYTKDVYRP